MLMLLLDMNLQEVKSMLRQISARLISKSKTALDILNERLLKACFLLTGMKHLDEAMKGGIPYGTITEICGNPGIGKTQFCLGVYVQFFLKFNSSKVVYFDTEMKFDVNRLQQIAKKISTSVSIDLMLSNVILKRPTTCKMFLSEIEELETLVISERINLVLIIENAIFESMKIH